MSNVIAQLAKTQPPKELLQHIDINDIYEKFHETFKRLDDFKDIRDKHEQRGFLGRLFRCFVVSCGFGLIEQASHRTADQVDHRDEVGLISVATGT